MAHAQETPSPDRYPGFSQPIAPAPEATAARASYTTEAAAPPTLSSTNPARPIADAANQPQPSPGQTTPAESKATPPPATLDSMLSSGPEQWTSPEGLGSSLKMMLLMAVISLAPAVLLMTTCFVRMTVVLGLLRQAIGAQQLPPNQVVTSLALFLTLVVMTPVWTQVYRDGIAPYTEKQKPLAAAWHDGVQPLRRFMSAQIEATGNRDDVWLFMRYAPPAEEPKTYDDVPLQVLLPAFMLSELKTAFVIGFQLFLPFLIIDLVVASVTSSMGMPMLPPSMISLPLKLLLFVLVDGWHLVVGMLLQSFQPFT
ncbi:MAG: flagellar type III secretion system pore protein FliP [Planctomycetia bacterium]|nr:flagellar type III secretion system pore protein FliP [Planctomycetia bacterium]